MRHAAGDRKGIDMESRVALVVGSTQGMGLDLAIRLARKGHAVAVNGRAQDRVDAAVAHVRTEVPQSRVIGVAADASTSDGVDGLFARVAEELGPIGIMIHAAVTRLEDHAEHTTDADWSTTMRVVLDGAFYCTRAAIPQMRSLGWGRIIYLGGISTEVGMEGRVALVAAKNGVYGMTKSVAAEIGRYGITVNVVSPGVIEDDPAAMPDDERTHRRTAMISGNRIPRFGTTTEVDETVMFLVSDDAGYITAQKISVSGGLHTF